MIAQRLAGTDGYGPPGFTLSALQKTMLGQRNYSADLGRAAVVAMCRAHPVLTASNGIVQPRAVSRVQAMIEEEARRGEYEPPADPATLAYAIVRLCEAFGHGPHCRRSAAPKYARSRVRRIPRG